MVFLFISILLSIATIIFLHSKIRIEILNFKFYSNKTNHINKNYKFIIQLIIFNKIRAVNIEINKNAIEKLNLKGKFEKTKLKFIENNVKIDSNIIKNISKLQFKTNYLNLDINLGTENSVYTSLLVPIISGIISYILSKNSYNEKSIYYKVEPIYYNQNIFNIELSGIFEIKMIHIINIIYILNRKKGVKNNERTSNRRSYDYSYE